MSRFVEIRVSSYTAINKKDNSNNIARDTMDWPPSLVDDRPVSLYSVFLLAASTLSLFLFVTDTNEVFFDVWRFLQVINPVSRSVCGVGGFDVFASTTQQLCLMTSVSIALETNVHTWIVHWEPSNC